MEVERIGGGPWKQNCYMVVFGQKVIIIDPGGGAEEILDEVRRRNFQVVAVLNTHGHFDHIGGVQTILEATGAPLYISSKEVPIMRSSNLLGFIFKSKEKIRIPKVFIDLEKMGTSIELSGMKVDCYSTPGHTPGGFCFLIQNHIFTGDTVLSGMPGTAELPGGNSVHLRDSLDFLGTLDKDLVLHPGHGRDSSLGQGLSSANEWIDNRVI